MDNNINIINDSKGTAQSNLNTKDVSKVDQLIRPNEIVPLQKEKPAENQQQITSNPQAQQQTKKDDNIKKPITTEKKNDDILNALDEIIKDGTKKLNSSIHNRAMLAIFTFGESERMRNLNIRQKLWQKVKPLFLTILSYITFGIYKVPEKKYNMRLAYELNERMRKIVNKS